MTFRSKQCSSGQVLPDYLGDPETTFAWSRGDYSLARWVTTAISTRRFMARPASLELLAIGCEPPRPSVKIISLGMPLLMR